MEAGHGTGEAQGRRRPLASVGAAVWRVRRRRRRGVVVVGGGGGWMDGGVDCSGAKVQRLKALVVDAGGVRVRVRVEVEGGC